MKDKDTKRGPVVNVEHVYCVRYGINSMNGSAFELRLEFAHVSRTKGKGENALVWPLP